MIGKLGLCVSFAITVLLCVIAVVVIQIQEGHCQAAPWYEEKYSHKLKDLSEDEYIFLAVNASDMELFETLLDPLLIPRLPGTANHTFVNQEIKNHFTNLGWHVEADTFDDETPYGVRTFENIIVTLNPNVSRRLVLACHYETKNFSGAPEFVGATDSAVPCTILLHLGSTLNEEFQAHKADESQNVTLQFIFFDGEEAFRFWTATDSIYGSRHLASQWADTAYPPDNQDGTTYLDRMDILMLLDLLGALQPTFPNFSSKIAHLHVELYHIEHALRRSRYWSGPHASKSYFETRFHSSNISDDHIPFLQRNVQVIHMIDYPFPTGWHTARDNKEILDFDTIDNLCRIIRIFVAKYIHLPYLY